MINVRSRVALVEAFPPVVSSESLPPVELVDKWEGPRTYAEDFYAGGDQAEESLAWRTPSHLTPQAGTPSPMYPAGEEGSPGAVWANTAEAAVSPASPEVIDVDDDEEELQPTVPPTFTMPLDEEGANDGFAELYGDLAAGPDVSQPALRQERNLPGTPKHTPPGSGPHTPEQGTPGSHLIPHDRSQSPTRVSPRGHVDWTYPPAFVNGRSVSELKSPQARQDPELNTFVIDDDEETDDFIGPLPLGAGKSDIPPHHDGTHTGTNGFPPDDGDVIIESTSDDFFMFSDSKLNLTICVVLTS